jgi:hypothetical protein
MTRVIEHRKALILRKQGKSYSQIKKELGISKSTLNGWLKHYPLSREQIRLLRDLNQERIEHYRNTMRRKLEKRLYETYLQQKRIWTPLTEREKFIAGLFLYWGEGGKTSRNTLNISNTDPNVMKFSLLWINQILRVPKHKIRVYLFLYSDMNVNKEKEYWASLLGLNISNFVKPYIKKSKKADIDQKGYGHGTCRLVVGNTPIKEKILMTTKAISDFYGGKHYVLV